MTEIEAAEMLKAYYVCQQMQVKGIYEKCNSNTGTGKADSKETYTMSEKSHG